MPHGTPDWGLVGPKDTTYGLDDLAEAVARLGSPHLFDRRGDVLSITAWRHGLGEWEYTITGGGGAVCLATEHSRTGPYSIGLTAGNDPLLPTYLRLLLPYTVLSGYGLEFTFSESIFTAYHTSHIDIDDGADLWEFGLRVWRVTGNVAVWGYLVGTLPAVNNWHVIHTAGPMVLIDKPRHTCKLVADASTQRYVRFILNDHTQDLSMYTLARAASVGNTEMMASIWHHAEALKNPISYIDNVVVTQNEPQ